METIRLQFQAKNNLILKEMERLGMSRKEFASYLGICCSTLSSLITMNFIKKNGKCLFSEERIKRISALIGHPPEVLFPNWAVYMARQFNTSHLELNDNTSKLFFTKGEVSNKAVRLLNNDDLKADINRTLTTILPKEAEIIKYWYGLDGYKKLTFDEIGQKMNLTRERTRQLKERGVRRLKHTMRSGILKQYI